MSFQHLPRVLTVEQTAGFLRLSADDIIAAMGCGELAVVRVDGTDLVDTAQLLSDLGIDRRLVRKAGSYDQWPRAEG